MSLTKTVSVDQITITENGSINYREATRILEGEIEISRTYHRNSLVPGQDTSGIPENVINIANVVWTPEVVAAYQAAIQAQQPE